MCSVLTTSCKLRLSYNKGGCAQAHPPFCGFKEFKEFEELKELKELKEL